MSNAITLERKTSNDVQEFVIFYDEYYAHTLKRPRQTVTTTTLYESSSEVGELIQAYMADGFNVAGAPNDK